MGPSTGMSQQVRETTGQNPAKNDCTKIAVSLYQNAGFTVSGGQQTVRWGEFDCTTNLGCHDPYDQMKKRREVCSRRWIDLVNYPISWPVFRSSLPEQFSGASFCVPACGLSFPPYGIRASLSARGSERPLSVHGSPVAWLHARCEMP